MADAALSLPPPALAGCVRAFYWRDVDGADLLGAGRGRTRIPPAPYIGLAWLAKGRAQLTHRGGEEVAEELPRAMLAGAHRHDYRSIALTPYRSFGIAFQPAALGLLSGIDTQQLAERLVPAADHLPADWHAWLDEVASLPDHRARQRCCEAFLSPRWAAVVQREPVWSRLADAAWARPAQQLAFAAMRWTQRHFQRRARERVGLAPRDIERLLRLEAALLDLRDGLPAAEVAAKHGYADQAHFSRESRAFFGQPPVAMLRTLADPALARDDGNWLLRLREQRLGD